MAQPAGRAAVNGFGAERLLAAAALWIVLAATGASAEEAAAVVVRTGDHPGFGRVVFTLPKGGSYESTTEGDRLLLVFKGIGTVERPAALPRNVVSMQTGQGTATMMLAPGVRVRPVRMGDRLVIDALDPAVRVLPSRPEVGAARIARTDPAVAQVGPSLAELKPPEAKLPEQKSPETRSPEAKPAEPKAAEAPVVVAPPAPSPVVHPETVAKTPEPSSTTHGAPVIPVEQEPLNAHAEDGPHAREHPAPASAGPSAPVVASSPAPPQVLLPVDAGVAAAAFRRVGLGMVVLDRRLALDTPTIQGAIVTQGAVSTTVQVPLPPDRNLRLERVAAGWTIDIVETVADALLETRVVPGGMLLPFARPGRIVTVLDPSNGGALLIGTSLVGGAEAALGAGRRTPDYALAPSWVGVVVEPLGDQVDLRAVASGFLLTGSAADAIQVSSVTEGRRFDLPQDSAAALQNRLKSQLASAASTSPRARTRERLAAVQTMLALGLGPEAQALLHLVAADDPQAAADAQLQALLGAAAVLANRLDEAGGLDDPRLENSSEAQLWRGLRDRRLGRASPAVRALPAAAALAWSYPETLRRAMWPDVAEAVVEAGVAIPTERLPPYAKAMLLERSGKVAEAITAYRALQDGPDRLDQVRGATRGAELRLASGQIGSGEAADVMERQAFAWRGDRHEATIRLRGAALRAAAGGWRAALDSLRETEKLFPEQAVAVAALKATVFQTMLSADGGAMSPLEVVLLAADYADCVPPGPTGAGLAALLADKLMALDLPARAIPVLQGLVQGAPAGAGRAEFGTRLARILIDGGDPAGAEAALRASDAAGLPGSLQEARALTLARARAAQGDTAGAVAGLVETGGAAADDLRAVLLAATGDWVGSLAALSDLASRLVPGTGQANGQGAGSFSDAAQDVLVRQASAATQAADGAALRRLGGYADRMSGARADLWRVLTAAPVTGAAELPRAAKELKLARAIPSRLQELGPR